MNPSDTFIIIISTADFYAKTRTNKQWMALTYEQLGYQVVYVNPFGFRLPTFTAEDVARVIRYLLSFVGAVKSAFGKPISSPGSSKIKVVYPFVLPKSNLLPKFLRRFFGLVVSLQIRNCRRVTAENTIVYAYHPFFEPIRGVLGKNTSFVLHLVDDLGKLPFINESLYRAALDEYMSKVDLVLCTNPYLASQIKQNSAKTAQTIYLEPNRVPDDCCRNLASIYPMSCKGNVLLVATLTESKVDFGCLLRSLDCLAGRLVVVGKIDALSDHRQVIDFLQHSSVDYLGELDLSEIRSVAKTCSYGLICNSYNGYNMSSTPMKFLDYVAMGLVPIAREFPYLELYRNFYFIRYNDHDSLCLTFRSIKSDELGVISEHILRNYKLLPSYTYQSRIAYIHSLLDTLNSRRNQLIGKSK